MSAEKPKGKTDRMPVNPLSDLIRDTTSKPDNSSKSDKLDNHDNLQADTLSGKPSKSRLPRKLDKSYMLVQRTFKISKKWDDYLNRLSHWDGVEKKTLVNRILKEALEGIDLEQYPPVPDKEEDYLE